MKAGILFVADRPQERFLKISYALKKSGVATYGVFRVNTDSHDLERYFDFYRFEPDTREIAKIVSRHPSDFIHLHSMLFDVTCLAVVNSGFKKIVYDPKDIFIGASASIFPDDVIRGHHYLLERSHGLLMRDLTAIWARKQGLKLAKNRIFFLDYCWSRDLLPSSVARVDRGQPVHLIFVGYFNSEISYPRYAGTGMIHISRSLIEQGFEVSIYPSSPVQKQDLSEYKTLSQLSEKFHLEPSLSPFELMKRMNSTVNAVGAEFVQSYEFPDKVPEPFFGADSGYDRVAMPSRLFSYFGAGIPVAWTAARPIASRFALRHKSGVAIPRGGLSTLSEYLHHDELLRLRPTVFQSSRMNLNVDTYIDRLIRFYRSL